MAREAIFIGYRRDDTADVAGRMYDALERKFGRDRLFKDVDNLRPGADFGAYIKSVLPRCQVALILIGPTWLDARDEAGARRLDDPNDWVRIEIETALATPGLDVVPVLVNGARMPKSNELPESLQPLLRRHAAVIRRDPDFRDDVGKLGAALSEQVKTGLLDLSSIGGQRKAADAGQARKRSGPSPVVMFAAGLVVVIAVAGGGWLLMRTQATSQNTSTDTTTSVAAISDQIGSQPTLAAITVRPADAALRPGQVFRDCDDCPDMVAIPAGSFVMGSPMDEAGRSADEGPQRRVSLRAFAAGRYEVTFDQWAACVNRGGCTSNPHPDDSGFTRGSRPVINVSWNDAQEYLRWLSQETGKSYRLLSEAEWEYAARAGTMSVYSTGSWITAQQAHVSSTSTAPVGSYPANPWGLYDMHGNVWEWVQDCYVNSYSGLPTDGSAYEASSCSDRVDRGGGWYGNARVLRSAMRFSDPPTNRLYLLGFRVARTI